LLCLCCDELRSSDRWNLLFPVRVADTRSVLTAVLNKFFTVRAFCQSDKPVGRSLRISTCARVCAVCGSRFASSLIPRHFAGHSCCMSRRLTYRSVAKCNGRVLALAFVSDGMAFVEHTAGRTVCRLRAGSGNLGIVHHLLV